MKLPARKELREAILETHHKTTQAKELADQFLCITKRQALLRSLMALLFDDDQLLRNCTSNVIRYMTDRQPDIFSFYADELIGLLACTPLEDHWSRYYLGLIAARSANDRAQRLRVAELMRRLLLDDHNAVRCTGIDGFVYLALSETSLREEALTILESALRSGTPAMRARARNMKKLMQKKHSIPM